MAFKKVRQFFGNLLTFPFDFGDTTSGDFLRIANDGKIYKYENDVLIGEYTVGGDGIYTPAPVEITNIDSVTMLECVWSKSGKHILVSGSFFLRPLVAGRVEFAINAPAGIDEQFDFHSAVGGQATSNGNNAPQLTFQLQAYSNSTDDDQIRFKGHVGEVQQETYTFCLAYLTT